MITKTAMSVADAAIMGASGGYGWHSANGLDSSETKALKKYYDLSAGADLKVRNLGRGIAGQAIGSLPGAILGYAVGGPNGVYIGGLGGGAIGTHLFTRKYSKGNAQRVKQVFKEMAQEQSNAD